MIAANGSLYLDGGAAVTTEVDLTNDGFVGLGAEPGGGPGTLNAGGNFANSGSVQIGSVATLSLTGAYMQTGGAASTLVNGTLSAASLTIDGGTYTNSGTTSIAGAINIGSNGTLTDSGRVTAGSSGAPGALNNAGSINTANGGELTVNGTVENSGSISIAGGGTVGSQSTMTVASIALGTLTGTFELQGSVGGAVLDYQGGGAVTQIRDGGANSGSLTLSGSNALIEANGVSALGSLTQIAGNGTLQLESGAMLTTNGPSTNQGILYLVGGTLAVQGSGTYTQTGSGASTSDDGTLIAPGGVGIEGGRLSGSGTVESNVTNDAIVSPGDPTALEIEGNYTQNNDGTLVIDIASATDYSVLDVTGYADLAGTIEFDFLNGYMPGGDTDFKFLTAGLGVDGSFTGLDVQGVFCPKCALSLEMAGNDAQLTWDPPLASEPSSLLLLALALLAISGVRLQTAKRLLRNHWAKSF